jgi:hypothetical protein
MYCWLNRKTKKKQINTFLDAWHKAAAETNSGVYFGSMTEDAIFIGTDATEVWLKKDFETWSKPYFDKGKAWDFTAISRNIYFGEKGKMAWFDENLDTWMGVCRGSGVLTLTKKGWKIKHYVLSVTIDNDLTDDFIALEKLLPEKKVKKVIQDLFKAMKSKDAALAKSVFAQNARLSTVETKDKKSVVKEGDIAKFIEFIGTPSENIYDEQVLSYDVKIDGDMATVWTPYEFYLNDKLLHCGVNAFQLFKGEEGWKILQITDTRRKENCKEK